VSVRTVKHDGYKFSTASSRRFVVFKIFDDDKPFIVKRTDSPTTAGREYVKRVGGSGRTVIVDFRDGDVPADSHAPVGSGACLASGRSPASSRLT